jgi:hypothetical protein
MNDHSTAPTAPSGIRWGVNAQTGVLTDVLLGKPDHFRWVATA